MRDQPQFFSEVAANWLIERAEESDDLDADSVQVRVGRASGNYFSTLGVPPMIGRTLSPDDNLLPGSHPVAVISYAYWVRRYGSAPDIVGSTLRLSGTTYAIIGVTPRGFTGEYVGSPTDLWVPFMMASQVMPEVPGGPSKSTSLTRFSPQLSQVRRPHLSPYSAAKPAA